MYFVLQGNKVNGEWVEINDMCVIRDVDVADNSNFKMTGLQGDSSYRIELRAHNAIGFSQPATLMMRTARGESTNKLGSLSYSSFGGIGAPGAGDGGAHNRAAAITSSTTATAAVLLVLNVMMLLSAALF